jgi:hypothetical protein
MNKSKILIVGDSFGTPSDKNYTWTSQLSQLYSVTNLCQNGVGQYKIHCQLMSTPIETFDTVILLITSPFRIHSEHNPFYTSMHPSHANCDLLYQDILNKPNMPEKDHILWWFENIFDLTQAEFVQNLIIEQDYKYLINHNKQVILMTFFETQGLTIPVNSCHEIWKKYPGEVNHLSCKGHETVLKLLLKLSESKEN